MQRLIEKLKEATPVTKSFLILIIILLVGIILRWSYVKEGIKRGFGRFGNTEQVDSLKQ